MTADYMNVLMRELGVRGMVSFLNQLSPPKGDYTKEREELLAGITMDDIMRGLEEKKKGVAP